MPRIYQRQPIAERFWPKVDKAGPTPTHRPDLGPCWLWTGARNALGYGLFNTNTTSGRAAHQVAFKLLIGPIPSGLELDHLCRNPSCVNPAHLEPVTHRTNSLRSTSPTAINATRTHCKYGHPFDAKNTHIRRNGGRYCRRCACRRAAEHIARRRAKEQER